MATVSSIERKLTRRQKLATVAPFNLQPIKIVKSQKGLIKPQSEFPSRVDACAKGSGSRSPTDKRRRVRSGKDARNGREGRREAKSKNNSLPLKQARAIRDGAWNAVQVGLPLNRFVTINWEQAGVADSVGATGMFLKLIKDVLRKKGQSAGYVWVQECGGVVGQHVHILLHLPPHLKAWFNGLQAGWLKRCGTRPGKGIVSSRPVGASYSAAFGDDASRANYRHALGRVLDYLLKDAEPRARAVLGIQHRGSFGTVVGKRSAVSQNLRSKAGLATTPAKQHTGSEGQTITSHSV